VTAQSGYPHRLQLGGYDTLEYDLTRKQILHLYIRIDRDTGRVKVSAPRRMSDKDVSDAVFRNRGWIERRRSEVNASHGGPSASLLQGDRIAIFGAEHELHIEESTGRPGCEIVAPGVIAMRTKPGAPLDVRMRLLDGVYRRQMERHIPILVDRWENTLGVEATSWQIRRMKTRWGSCNPVRRRISLNLRLVAYPLDCLEYVVVHELAHLLVPDHGPGFYAVLDRHHPDWKAARTLLRGAPRRSAARGAPTGSSTRR
jgi:predicted metal-dependent hydrolase